MMIKLFSIFVLIITLINSSIQTSVVQSKLIVTSKPSYQKYDYTSTNSLKLSDLNNIILAANGFSIEKTPEWKGLKTTNPLSVPKATVLFLVNSNNLTDSFLANKFIPITEDATVNIDDLITKMGSSVKSRIFNDLTSNLNNLENDCSGTMSTVFYVFKVPDSEMQLLAKYINNITQTFNQICSVDQNNDLLVYVLATANQEEQQQQHVIKKRQATGPTGLVLNPAEFYSDQYPAIFNILFWTTLLIALAIYGIVYGMYSMDPGLDTVIYRMTSQRVKKEQ